MKTVALSEKAVAALRFEIRGLCPKDPSRRLPAYRELADAGIMERVPGTDAEGEYRFTAFGLAHREAILEREAERIERERHEPPDASRLSPAAWDLLRRLAADERIDVTEKNRPLYRELRRPGS